MDINHEFSSFETKSGEKSVQAMITFIEQHKNPFIIEENSPKRLHNIFTQEIATDEIRQQILEIQNIGQEKYAQHRHDHFISKTLKISNTIHRTNLRTLHHLHKTTPKSKTKKVIQKESQTMQKILNVAQSRGNTMENIVEYDISDQSTL